MTLHIDAEAAAALDWPRLGRVLVRWFDDNKRSLPWRENRNPYRVWVAEIMLQQTRVDAAKHYYIRFLEKFPTIQALADATEDDVLKAWEGLGYYSRARNLRRAAREVVARYDGQLPADPEQLRTLPGIGPYTSGAIASIAFNKPEPAVDGNVLRVVSRVAGIDQLITRAAVHRQIGAHVAAMMPPGRASAFTESLMELGALVCIPGEPRCHLCPWADDCIAREAGIAAELPVRPARQKQPVVHGAVAIVTDGAEVFVVQRPADGLLAGLWEFPWVELPAELAAKARHPDTRPAEAPPESTAKVHPEIAVHIEDTLRTRYGLDTRCRVFVKSVRHVFSHLEWRLQAYVVRLVGSRPVGRADASSEAQSRGTTEENCETATAWVDTDGLEELPFGRAHRRIATAWAAQSGEGETT